MESIDELMLNLDLSPLLVFHSHLEADLTYSAVPKNHSLQHTPTSARYLVFIIIRLPVQVRDIGLLYFPLTRTTFIIVHLRPARAFRAFRR